MKARRFHPEDAESALAVIQSIKRPVQDPTLTVDYMRGFLSRVGNILIVASEGVEAAGYAIAYVLDRIDRAMSMVCLYEVEVAEAFRRRGAGRAMITALKESCRDIGAVKMWTVADRSNEAAVRLYEGTGAIVDSEGNDIVLVWRTHDPA